MGNKSSLLLREEEIAQIQEESGCEYAKNENLLWPWTFSSFLFDFKLKLPAFNSHTIACNVTFYII